MMCIQLERRAEAISGGFNSQDIANTLWAYATMGTKPGERILSSLVAVASCLDFQFFVGLDLLLRMS
jgi:hypothetical protein